MSAIRPHGTPTTDEAWDGPANEARLPNDAGAAVFTRYFAWRDPDGDPDTKAAYKFGHHMVSGSGEVGAANMIACSTGIGVLNGGRGGTTIPDADRSAVHQHFAKHLLDGDRDVPELKAHKLATVKFAAGSDSILEGLAIPYGGPFNGRDLDGEFFTKDTNFCLDWFPSRPLIYDHGLDPTIKTAVVGGTVAVMPQEEGIWTRVQLDVRNRYLRAIQELVQKSALGFSSGAMAHLVRVDNQSGEIKQWPWVELSTTPTPSNPDAIVYTVKSRVALEHLAALDADSGSESFDDQGARVVAEVEKYAKRVHRRYAQRAAKVGRELSATNRGWLQSLDERLAALLDLRGEIKEALRRTDPEAEKAARAEFARFLELQAADLGVPLKEN